MVYVEAYRYMELLSWGGKMKIPIGEFQDLLYLLQDAEDEAVIIKTSVSNECSFNIISRNCKEVPNIVFRFTEDSLILSNIYLKNKGIGTGKILVVWLINYAEKKGMTFFKIVYVNPNSIALKKIAERYNMHIKQDGESFDYILRLKI